MTTYEQNSGLDLNRDGSITNRKAAAKVREHYSNMQFVTSDGNVTKDLSNQATQIELPIWNQQGICLMKIQA